MRTPLGLRGHIIERFGWTYKYLLWGIPWLDVHLMMIDAPRYIPPPTDEGKGKAGPKAPPVTPEEKADSLNSFLMNYKGL